jgi:hypothetical protein
MPLKKAPWGDIFGVCADKFGVNGWSTSTAASPRPVDPQRGWRLAASVERAGEADQGGHVVRPFEGGRVRDIALADAALELCH